MWGLRLNESLVALALAAGLSAAGAGSAAGQVAPAIANAQPVGIDVSATHGDVNWDGAAASNVRFAYIHATEGIQYKSPTFAAQYDGAADDKLIRGAYHVALPDQSSGAAQADFFVDNGGGWSADGQTLPGAVSLSYNPAGATCYDLSPAELIDWIHDFADEYKARVGREVVIQTTADWWNSCTDSATEFGLLHPLWVAQYGISDPMLPAGWSYYTFWQYASTSQLPGVSGVVTGSLFKGDAEQLQGFARGTLPPQP